VAGALGPAAAGARAVTASPWSRSHDPRTGAPMMRESLGKAWPGAAQPAGGVRFRGSARNRASRPRAQFALTAERGAISRQSTLSNRHLFAAAAGCCGRFLPFFIFVDSAPAILSFRSFIVVSVCGGTTAPTPAATAATVASTTPVRRLPVSRYHLYRSCYGPERFDPRLRTGMYHDAQIGKMVDLVAWHEPPMQAPFPWHAGSIAGLVRARQIASPRRPRSAMRHVAASSRPSRPAAVDLAAAARRLCASTRGQAAR